VGGFTKPNALEYIEKRGVELADAVPILESALEDIQSETYHTFSLGLACDLNQLLDGASEENIAELETNTGLTKEEALIGRFLVAVDDTKATRLRFLANTPVWDDEALAFAMGGSQDPEAASVLVEWLHRFSFVLPLEHHRYGIHGCLRRSLLGSSSNEERDAWHRRWMDYWTARSSEATDWASSRMWLHYFSVNPDEAIEAWDKRTEETWSLVDMAQHLWLVELGQEFTEGWLRDTQLSELHYSRAAWLVTWAGAAYRTSLGESRLREAVKAYESALEVYRKETLPADWAMAQNNLGIVLGTLGQRENDPEILARSVKAYESALEVRTKEALPAGWAMTQNNLGNVLRTLGARENDPEILARSVKAFESALEVRTKEALPADWAMTQNNLGIVLGTLGERENDPEILARSVKAYESALEVFREDAWPGRHSAVKRNLETARVLLARLLSN
jgi:tetratricopeptide (TPR) repeat protein